MFSLAINFPFGQIFCKFCNNHSMKMKVKMKTFILNGRESFQTILLKKELGIETYKDE